MHNSPTAVYTVLLMVRQYTNDQTAHALAQLVVYDGNVKRTARELGMPPPTLRLWRDRALAAGMNLSLPVPQKESWPERIRVLWEHYLELSLCAGIAQAEIASDPSWLRQQDAHGLGILHGIMQDKARLLTEAAARSARLQQAEAGEAITTEDKNVK